MTGKTIEIRCTACGADALLRREASYEGFKRVGERLFCATCGHEYADERDVPFKTPVSTPRVFSEADRPCAVRVFRESEKGGTCRLCRHYVVNPFIQRCGLHNRMVEATDSCGDFAAKPVPPAPPAPQP